MKMNRKILILGMMTLLTMSATATNQSGSDGIPIPSEDSNVTQLAIADVTTCETTAPVGIAFGKSSWFKYNWCLFYPEKETRICVSCIKEQICSSFCDRDRPP